MSLKERAEAFNAKHQKDITALDVRQHYHGAGITKQRYVINLGPPKPTAESMEISRHRINLAKN